MEAYGTQDPDLVLDPIQEWRSGSHARQQDNKDNRTTLSWELENGGA